MSTAPDTPCVNPRIARFAPIEHLLRCPRCATAVHLEGTNMVCETGHAYSVAARGYANFMPEQRALKGYDRAFFQARRKFLDEGLYDHVVAEALRAVENHCPQAAIVVDAGCGEGHYARALSERFGTTVLGVDVAKDALFVAAAGGNPVHWLVGDVANLPLADHVADVLLDAFTPANYREFARVLKPGGILIKVVPGADHLCELRHEARSFIAHESYSNQDVVTYFAQHLTLLERTRATHTVELTAEQAQTLLHMTPVLFGASERQLATIHLDRITIDAEVLVGRV